MVFRRLCVLVLWMKGTSVFDGLKHSKVHEFLNYLITILFLRISIFILVSKKTNEKYAESKQPTIYDSTGSKTLGVTISSCKWAFTKNSLILFYH